MKISDTVKKYMLQGLDDMRQSIDSLDTALFYLIVERIHLVIHVGASKIKQSVSLERSAERSSDLINIVKELNADKVNKEFFQNFFEKVYAYSLDIMEYMEANESVVRTYLDTFSGREMEDYRALLRVLDRAVCNMLLYRFDIVYQVGVLKQEKNVPPLALDRWQKVIAHKRSMAEENGISPDFIESLYEVIHTESLRIEESIDFKPKSQEYP